MKGFALLKDYAKSKDYGQEKRSLQNSFFQDFKGSKPLDYKFIIS